ncbi:MAG TPA: Os1348 family NHLP clan protein [Ktedonobacteraceae bacterium]
MSWEILNRILGLASINQEFARELLKDPCTAIRAQGFELTAEEQRAFNEIKAGNLIELSQQLMQRLHHSDLD